MDKNRVFLLTREQKKALKTQKIINNLGAKAVISPLCVVRKKTRAAVDPVVLFYTGTVIL